MLKKMTSWAKRSKKISRPESLRRYARLLGDRDGQLKRSPLGWAVTRAATRGDTLPTIERWHRAITRGKKMKSASRDILATTQSLNVGDSQQLRSDVETALLAVAAATAMPTIARHCDEGDWNAALDHLVGLSASSRANWGLMPLGYQLVSVELPMTLAFLLPKFDELQYTCRAANSRLTDSLGAMLDFDGWPASEYLPVFGPLVASWTRCLRIADKLKLPADPSVAEQVQWLIPQVLRLMRNDGSLMLGGLEDQIREQPLTRQLLKLHLGKKRDRRYAEVARQRRPLREDVQAADMQESSLSEWATSGVFQSQWQRRTPKIAFDFSSESFRTEIGRNVPLILGEALPVVQLNGQTCAAESDFAVVCEEQSDKLDFVELEMSLSGGVRLQRQIALSREEEFLLLADVLVTEEAGSLAYRCQWPLAGGVVGMHETETNEIYLTADGKIQALVLPIALPEWKSARSDGCLECDDKSLTLAQTRRGTTLYAPLFFDLSPRRSRRPRTWRPLTVAETRRIVPDEVAVAFRMQLDDQQWILYRSLTANGNRTFMGENFAGEFFLGQFNGDGEVTPLLQIE